MGNTVRHEREEDTRNSAPSRRSGSPKLGSAQDYANRLSEALATPQPTPDLSERKERVAVAVDAVGNMQTEIEALSSREAQIRERLANLIAAPGTEIEGKAYKAICTEVPVSKLKQPTAIHTLLIALLAQIDEKHAGNGGLFDMILSLDSDLVNQHLVPLLNAIFEKEGMTEEASHLFITDSIKTLEVKALD